MINDHWSEACTQHHQHEAPQTPIHTSQGCARTIYLISTLFIDHKTALGLKAYELVHLGVVVGWLDIHVGRDKMGYEFSESGVWVGDIDDCGRSFGLIARVGKIGLNLGRIRDKLESDISVCGPDFSTTEDAQQSDIEGKIVYVLLANFLHELVEGREREILETRHRVLVGL
ncbi:hypothetical protein BDN71DRAFT_676146 [Pleurotus eryngii]|uniref:Uncharacterized protein n=1 Tax=Pleurotus eryngii TaxID=5323 RepID=A0A9P6A1A4_PLEER|nr:hypothetical protein BDN71DRAFT_676146 [Pleurotus eryngii]